MELTNEELASIGENGWQADADTVRALIWEIRVLRASDEKMSPSLRAIQAYLKKYEVGLGSGGQQVTQILLDDAERQREEIAALRGQLQSAQAVIKEGARTPDDVDYAEYVESYERAMGVRPDAPAPEPAPEIKKGDKVGVIRAHGHGDKKLIGLEGIVTEVREGEELTYRYTVKIGERRHFLARDQIIPLSAD